MGTEEGSLQQEVTNAGAAAGAPAVTPATPATPAAAEPAPSTPVDTLDAEIAANDAAIKAAEAGQPAAQPAASPAGTPASAPAGQPGSAAQAAPAGQPGPTVPLKAFTRMRDEAARWRDQALINEGAARAAVVIAQTGGQAAAGTPATVEETPEQKIAGLNAKKEAIAAKFDAGTITMAEATKQQSVIDDDIFTIRAEGLKAPAAQASPNFDSTVETHANTVVAANPVLNHLNEQQIQNLTADAYERAELEGKPIGKGALETMRLRDLVGSMATEKYAKFYVKAGTAANGGAPLPSAGAPQGGQPAGQPGLSAAARARDAKLDLQNRMPPDASAVGSPDAGTQKSEAEIMASLAGLSEDEQIRRLDAMPGVVQRLTGISKL